MSGPEERTYDGSTSALPGAEKRQAGSAAAYTVVARRYRPQRFDELIGQQHVARALKQAILSGRVGHAYLFTGARGVGKTSAARIFAKAINCPHNQEAEPCNACELCQGVASGEDVDVIEIDGASNRQLDDIRQLRQNVAIRPSRARFKVYLIDEVHMLTREAFNALLKTLEEPPDHVKFLFATTDPQKVPITILSRCQRFDFAGVDSLAIQTRLAQIAEAEGVRADADALQILATRAAGSMRDSQSLLEQLLAAADEHITAQQVQSLLGIASAQCVGQIAGALAQRDAATALSLLEGALGSGADAGQLLDQLIGYYRDVMTLAVGCPPERLLTCLPADAPAAAALGESLGVATVLAVLQVLDQTAARLRVSLHSRTLVEMALVRVAALEDLQALADVVAAARSGALSAATHRAPAPSVSTPPRPTPGPPSAPQPSASRSPQPPAPPPLPEPQVSQGAPPSKPQETPGGGSGILAMFELQQAEAATTGRRSASPPPVNRRKAQADALENPFVKQAMEVFGVEADGIRYSPPRPDQGPAPRE